MSVLELTVVDSERIAWKGNAKGIVLGVHDGLYGVLPGHADAVMLISPSILKIDAEEGKAEDFFVSGGCLKIEKGIASLLADSVETKSKIDLNRAKAAEERARKRLEMASHDIDYARARSSLQRALIRQKFVENM
jgi:F-type H+-transporting ATPase subunit epsilon